MGVHLRGRSLLTLMDLTPEEIRYLLDLAHDLKSKKRAGINTQALKGKNLVLLFEKTSTRTRCAFEVAAYDEGAGVTFLDSASSQFGKKESLEDTAKVLGRFYDGIEYRGYDQKVVEDLAKYAGVPVWNGLTDVDHPTQILADLMTIEEHVSKPLNKVKVVFSGDIRNNMSYAWMYGCAKMGMHYVAYGPDELAAQLDQEVLAKVKEVADYTGATIEISSNPECLKGADVIYADVWASMGEEAEIPERVKLLTPYRVTKELMDNAGAQCRFMHCLPAFHDSKTGIGKQIGDQYGLDCLEVTDEVFESEASIVFDEAENRMHTIKAVIAATLGAKFE